MSHRKSWALPDSKDPTFQAICRCGWRSTKSVNRQVVEDEVMGHDRKIDQLRASLGGQPTLKSQRDYFRAQADDPGNTDSDRRLWGQLADELDSRLNDSAPADQGQSSLW